MTSISDQAVENRLPMVCLNFKQMEFFSNSGTNKVTGELAYSSNSAKKVRSRGARSKVWSIVNLKCPHCQRETCFPRQTRTLLKAD
jgi:hypothetical protein